MLRIVAWIFSVVFHPLLLPTYTLLLTDYADPYRFAGLDYSRKLKFFGMVAMNTFCFPVLAVLLLWRLNLVRHITLSEREERTLPYVALSMFFFWTFMVVRSLELDTLITTFFLGAAITVFACFFLNLFMKISAHTAGAGLFTFFTILLASASPYNIEALLIGVMILSGVIGSSRMYLRAHTSLEIYSGYATGVLGMMMAIRFI
ncbi:MAG: hypothetical protein KatS3mg031_2478 [Chitinophagales bacterium]|nr:MAG: hypothetical protein KatS3mg031_2478 [Chitinophagales bacterium]